MPTPDTHTLSLLSQALSNTNNPNNPNNPSGLLISPLPIRPNNPNNPRGSSRSSQKHLKCSREQSHSQRQRESVLGVSEELEDVSTLEVCFEGHEAELVLAHESKHNKKR